MVGWLVGLIIVKATGTWSEALRLRTGSVLYPSQVRTNTQIYCSTGIVRNIACLLSLAPVFRRKSRYSDGFSRNIARNRDDERELRHRRGGACCRRLSVDLETISRNSRPCSTGPRYVFANSLFFGEKREIRVAHGCFRGRLDTPRIVYLMNNYYHCRRGANSLKSHGATALGTGSAQTPKQPKSYTRRVSVEIRLACRTKLCLQHAVLGCCWEWAGEKERYKGLD